MFALSAYLGARLPGPGGGWVGSCVALVATFLPGFLLISGVLPFWRALAGHPGAARAIAGVSAAVVGLLAAALYDPVWVSAVRGPADVAIAGVALLALARWQLAVPLIVLLCVASSVALAAL